MRVVPGLTSRDTVGLSQLPARHRGANRGCLYKTAGAARHHFRGGACAEALRDSRAVVLRDALTVD